MKKVKVIVKEKTILELAEDAYKGDLIDLQELVEVDSSYLESIIDSGKDKVYKAKLEEFKKVLDAENLVKTKEAEKKYDENINLLNHKIKEIELQKKGEIDKLLEQIESSQKDSLNKLSLKEKEVESRFINQINELNKNLEMLKANQSFEINDIKNKNDLEIQKIKSSDDLKYSELKQKYDSIVDKHQNELEQCKKEIEAKYKIDLISKDSEIARIKQNFELEKEKLLVEQKNKFDEEIKIKEDTINNLQRAKASMNVKQTGEDLETWCNNEVDSYMQNGLLNCTWEKDNKVIKDENEDKGSKADYIFKIYADSHHNENELLAAVCLDMKDENPNSVNKKTNADHYKQLDKNREKKNCRYAVLVSNLEMDKPNASPIFKVREYENMYVVRPAYLMVFLNMITSLTTRFSELVLSKESEKIELKNRFDLIDEFDKIKNTYLDKPLESLKNNLANIEKSSEQIKKACKNIDEENEKIRNNYINQIVDKISKFELKMNRGITNKLDD